MPWNPDSPGCKRLVEVRHRFAEEQEVVVRSFWVGHECSTTGSLISRVATPGQAVRLPSGDAAELVGLNCWHLDFEPGVIRVRDQVDRMGTRQPLKTEKGRRDVVLQPSLARL